MCGISGIYFFSKKSPSVETIKKIIDPISHRGPDGEGIFVEESCGLGHKRLAILDLSDLAAQPMVSFHGRYVIVYNGEIYNYAELREELKSRGYRFKSQSDTEVLLNYYEEFGSEGIKNLNGHFAFAIYDKKERTLTLVRDRFGVKPIYYYRDEEMFVFSSEIKGILPIVKAEINKSVIPEYFSFQNFFSTETPFKGIEIVSPGEYIQVHSEGVSKYRYHNLHFNGENSDIHIEDIDAALDKAVKRQINADVDVNIYLSGGIDSGLIGLYASKHRILNSFTIGFDLSQASGIELGFDERANAEKVSSLINSEQYEMVLKSGDMERCLDHLIYHIEEPRIGQCYPNYYAAKLASKFGKVVLSGVGGDELFAGYPWRYYHADRELTASEYKKSYFSYWQRLLNDEELKGCFPEPEMQSYRMRAKTVFSDLIDSCIHTPYDASNNVNYSLEFETKTFLHGLLCVEDKISMAFGLETRAPFLDNEILSLAENMHISLKLHQDTGTEFKINENVPGLKKSLFYQQTKNGKIVLRHLMAKKLPPNFQIPAKQGFSAPDASWFKGKSIELIRSDLLTPNAKIWDYLDYRYTKSLIEEHFAEKRNRRLLLWSLLYFNRFLEIFKL